MVGRGFFRTAVLACVALGAASAQAMQVETGWYAVGKDKGCALTHIDRQRQSFVTYEEDFELGQHVLEFGHEDRDARQGTAKYDIALGARRFPLEVTGEWIGYMAVVAGTDVLAALRSAPSIVVTDQSGATVFEATFGSRGDALARFDACVADSGLAEGSG